MENKKRKISLIAIFGIIAGLIWVSITLVTLSKIPEFNKLTQEEINKIITQDTTKQPDLEVIKGTLMPGVKISEVGHHNKELLDKGEALFKSTCSSCHGTTGMGDGAGGATLNPKPRNFHQIDNWKNGRNISGMFKTLVEGIPNSGMTAYEFIPIEERFGVIYYIRNMIGGFPEITETELKLIDDTYDVSQPRLSSSQIPMSLATKKIITENKSLRYKIDHIVAEMNQDKSEQSELFNKVVSDKRYVVETLLRDKSWILDLNNFIQKVTNVSYRNGFKPNIIKFSKEDFIKLHTYLGNVLL